MLQTSFLSLVRWSFPRLGGYKLRLRLGVWSLAATSFLAACGGMGADETQVVEGRGFTFEAPADWTLVRTPRAIGAQGDAVELVQVTHLPLARAYSAQLFERVVPELDAAARAVARQTGAEVESRTVEVLGEPTRQYDLAFEGKFEQLTFVLRGKTNYQLLCRREADGDNAPCETLVESFQLA
jgi:hypothetical protein